MLLSAQIWFYTLSHKLLYIEKKEHLPFSNCLSLKQTEGCPTSNILKKEETSKIEVSQLRARKSEIPLGPPGVFS